MTTILLILVILTILSTYNLCLMFKISKETKREIENLNANCRVNELEISGVHNILISKCEHLVSKYENLNSKVVNETKEIRERIEVVENPAKFKLGDSIYKIEDGQFMGIVSDFKFCGFYWSYTVLIDGKKMELSIINQESFTNIKPKYKSKK